MIFKRIDEVGTGELAALFTDAFADYIAGDIRMDSDGIASFLYANHVSPDFSKLMYVRGRFAALALMTRYQSRSRVAAMGVAASMRGQKFGDRLLTMLCEESVARGDRAVVLEVIEQNHPAVALYRKHDFREVRRLCGWRIDKPVGVRGVKLAEVTAAHIAAAAEQASAQELPWQIGLPNLTRLPDTARIYKYGDTHVVVLPGEDGELIIEALFTGGPKTNVSEATDCLSGLFAKYPARMWKVPVRFPESYDRVFATFAASRNELTQLQMERLC